MDSCLVMFDRLTYFLFALQNYEKLLRQDWFKLVHFQILMKKMKKVWLRMGKNMYLCCKKGIENGR